MKDIILAIVIAIAAIGALGMALRQVFDRIRKEPFEVMLVDGGEEVRCPCGALATHPMPVLARHREDGVASKDREKYAGAPHYQRQVSEGSLALCRVHAHLADAKMDEFIYVSIRAIQADCNAKIAKEAATFEKETLPKFIEDSLTEREKKEKRILVTTVKSNGSSTNPSVLSLS